MALSQFIIESLFHSEAWLLQDIKQHFQTWEEFNPKQISYLTSLPINQSINQSHDLSQKDKKRSINQSINQRNKKVLSSIQIRARNHLPSRSSKDMF